MEEPQISIPKTPFRAWFGTGGLVAALVFVLGRIALEPLRTLPQFDDESMDSYAAAETYRLRKDPHPAEVAIFGSSVTIWGILPELVAEELGEKPENLRKLGVQGGTAFDMWNLVRRNEKKLDHLRIAVVEVSPRTLDLENGRVDLAISKYGSWRQRLLLSDKTDRAWKLAEWLLPLESVRRSLRSAFLNVVKPYPGLAMYPEPDSRLYPNGMGWHVKDDDHEPHTLRTRIDANEAARRTVEQWKVSKIHDDAMRKLVYWLRERHVKVFLYQMPIHPEMAASVRNNPRYLEGYTKYLDYVASLGVKPEYFIKSEASTECGIPVEGMRDYSHLNEAGAKIYSHYLGKRIHEVVAFGRRKPGTHYLNFQK